MALLEEVKTILRIKSEAFDAEELTPLIDACKADMSRRGVNPVSEKDPLVKQAIKLYCKANFGFSDDSEKFQTAYESLRDSLALFTLDGGGGDAVP